MDHRFTTALVPHAVTSTAGGIHCIGDAAAHFYTGSLYVSAIAGVVHYYWLVKSDIRLPVLYGAILTILLAYRLLIWHPRWLLGGSGAKNIPPQRFEKEVLLRPSLKTSLQPQPVVPRGASTL